MRDLRVEETAAGRDGRDDERSPELVPPEQVADRVERPPNAGQREHADDDAEHDQDLPHDAEDGEDDHDVLRHSGGRVSVAAVGVTLTAPGWRNWSRRARLKIGWPSGRAGSSPAPGIPEPSGGVGVRRPPPSGRERGPRARRAGSSSPTRCRTRRRPSPGPVDDGRQAGVEDRRVGRLDDVATRRAAPRCRRGCPRARPTSALRGEEVVDLRRRRRPLDLDRQVDERAGRDRHADCVAVQLARPARGRRGRAPSRRRSWSGRGCRPRRGRAGSPCAGASSSCWSPVYACTVVISPWRMPTPSCSTFATGARQFVVQDALEMIGCFAGSYDVLEVDAECDRRRRAPWRAPR